jgi:rare lipoprotein A
VAGRSPGRIFVQAGTFAVPENAQRVRARIASLGSVEIVRSAARGSALYQVRLGPVASEAAAARLLGKVVGSGYPGARVVSE